MVYERVQKELQAVSFISNGEYVEINLSLLNSYKRIFMRKLFESQLSLRRNSHSY